MRLFQLGFSKTRGRGHISPSFQKITLREGARGGGGGGWFAEKKMECPLSKETVLFKRNTIGMADIYCSSHYDMKQKIINIFKCIKEQNAQKQGGDGKWGEGEYT